MILKNNQGRLSLIFILVLLFVAAGFRAHSFMGGPAWALDVGNALVGIVWIAPSLFLLNAPKQAIKWVHTIVGVVNSQRRLRPWNELTRRERLWLYMIALINLLIGGLMVAGLVTRLSDWPGT